MSNTSQPAIFPWKLGTELGMNEPSRPSPSLRRKKYFFLGRCAGRVLARAMEPHKKLIIFPKVCP